MKIEFKEYLKNRCNICYDEEDIAKFYKFNFERSR